MQKNEWSTGIKSIAGEQLGNGSACTIRDGNDQPSIPGNKSQVLDEAQVALDLMKFVRRCS